jgi:hypothetical protein
MTLLDLPSVRAAWRFPLHHPGPVAFGAALYAPVFALQSVGSAQAALAVPGAAPLAILAALAALAVFVISLAAWARLALSEERSGLFAHRLGQDEARLGIAAVLLLILTFTVVGTAFLALAFMIAALALINVDPQAPAPEGGIDIFALLGPGELAVAVIVIAAFALFSAWFFLRLALAYPATLALGKVQVLTAWPMSGRGRAVEVLLTVLAACAPGAVVLIVLNLLSQSLLGAWPGSASSALADGALGLDLMVFAGASAVYGFFKIALVGAPAARALCGLFVKYNSQSL